LGLPKPAETSQKAPAKRRGSTEEDRVRLATSGEGNQKTWDPRRNASGPRVEEDRVERKATTVAFSILQGRKKRVVHGYNVPSLQVI
jgi:hypothetical protein